VTERAVQLLPLCVTVDVIIQAVGQLSTFIEFITYEYLIENIQFVITGLIKGSQPETLITKCKPLGESPHLKSILTFENFESGDGLVELYRTVLVDTPVAKYFAQYFNKEMTNEQSKREFPREVQRHYDEQDIDIITNMLQKLWLEDFYYYCKGLGGDTAAVMTDLLSFEADKRAINITINSFRNSLNDDINRDTKRQELYCSFGHLYPVATLKEFVRVKNMDVLKEVLQPYQDYSTLWRNAVDAGSGARADEEKGAGFYDAFQDQLFKHEVKLCKEAFERQCHFAGFYAFVKLKQQEERNLQWILNCINMGRGKEDRDRWVKTF
jgi:V-type H+-transporting ATPase subunit d